MKKWKKRRNYKLRNRVKQLSLRVDYLTEAIHASKKSHSEKPKATVISLNNIFGDTPLTNQPLLLRIIHWIIYASLIFIVWYAVMLISFKNIRDRSNAHALQVLTNNSVPIYLVLLAIIFVVFFAFIILIRKRTIAYANAYHIDAYDTHHFILLMIMYAMYFFILAVPMMIAWVTFINSGFVAKMANNIPINNPYEYVAALVLVLIITNAVPFMCAFIILYIDKKMDKARILCYPKTLTDNS